MTDRSELLDQLKIDRSAPTERARPSIAVTVAIALVACALGVGIAWFFLPRDLPARSSPPPAPPPLIAQLPRRLLLRCQAPPSAPPREIEKS